MTAVISTTSQSIQYLPLLLFCWNDESSIWPVTLSFQFLHLQHNYTPPLETIARARHYLRHMHAWGKFEVFS